MPGTAPAEPHEVRLPGFIPDETVGLGDALKRVTSAVGHGRAVLVPSARSASIVGLCSADEGSKDPFYEGLEARMQDQDETDRSATRSRKRNQRRGDHSRPGDPGGDAGRGPAPAGYRRFR